MVTRPAASASHGNLSKYRFSGPTIDSLNQKYCRGDLCLPGSLLGDPDTWYSWRTTVPIISFHDLLPQTLLPDHGSCGEVVFNLEILIMIIIYENQEVCNKVMTLEDHKCFKKILFISFLSYLNLLIRGGFGIEL